MNKPDYNKICWHCDARYDAVPRQADWIDIVLCHECRKKQDEIKANTPGAGRPKDYHYRPISAVKDLH